MARATQASDGPNFAAGIAVDTIENGTILRGNVNGTPALAVRREHTLHFIGANCTHYGLPLEGGLVAGEQLRCPFHHARFCLKTGAAVGAPALDDLDCWATLEENGMVKAGAKLADHRTESSQNHPGHPARVVIIGGGAAGHAAAEMLRAEGYGGSVTLLSADRDLPYDRPKLSKAVLSGQAEPESIFWRDTAYYASHGIDIRTDTAVKKIDKTAKTVTTDDGQAFPYDALLLAAGAEPKRLDVPGADQPHVMYLRTLDDARRLSSAVSKAKRAVVIGASFIGLEAAAGLRTRGLEVDVIANAPLPMEKILGKPLSDKLRKLHESHGVRFHIGAKLSRIESDAVTLVSGKKLDADLVLVGIGVAPRVALAQEAGLAIDDGVKVDAFLRTDDPNIYAAGDLAQWPDPIDAGSLRVEHWVVAQRQGQAAARNILGRAQPFEQAPFFWSIQYDLGVGYIGHVSEWEHTETAGDLDKNDWSMTFFKNGEPRAMAIVSKNLDGLEMEQHLERRMRERA